jgi:hypothetical protein
MKADSHPRPAVAVALWAVLVITISVLLTLVHAAVSQPHVSLEALAHADDLWSRGGIGVGGADRHRGRGRPRCRISVGRCDVRY